MALTVERTMRRLVRRRAPTEPMPSAPRTLGSCQSISPAVPPVSRRTARRGAKRAAAFAGFGVAAAIAVGVAVSISAPRDHGVVAVVFAPWVKQDEAERLILQAGAMPIRAPAAQGYGETGALGAQNLARLGALFAIAPDPETAERLRRQGAWMVRAARF